MADGAPILHERLLTMNSAARRSGGWGDNERQTTRANRFEFRLGDVDEGFAQARERHRRARIPHEDAVHQGYIEPHSATAWWTPQDRFVTVWCSSAGTLLRYATSPPRVRGRSRSRRVKVVPMEIGGGFGGKTQGGIYLEPLAVASCPRNPARPVKITMNRESR